jgi:hypothetical protein
VELKLSLRVKPWLPKQAAFLSSPAKFRAYIGGFGAGKTIVLCAEAIVNSLWYPNNRGVILSPSFPMLHDNIIPVLKAICPSEILYGGSWDTAFNKTHSELLFVNGSILLLRSADDPSKILGQTLGHAHLDEAALMPVDIWLALKGRLRLEGVRLTMTVASNPESQAHWLYEYFVEKKDDDGQSNTYALFKAPSTENKYLPPEYVADLMKYPADWRKRYVEGEFTSFEGQIYFLNEDIHYVEPADFGRAFGDDPITFWSHGMGIDPAESQPTAAWGCFRDPQGRRWYVSRYSEENRVTSAHCKALIKVLEKWHRPPGESDLVMDPSAGAARYEGHSILDGYYEGGLFPRLAESCRGDDKVIWGIDHVREQLWVNPEVPHPITGRPGCPQVFFVLYPDVREGLKFITSYRWKEVKNPMATGITRERPLKYKDHDPDAFRYRECEYLALPETIQDRQKRERMANLNLAQLDPATGFSLY